MSRSRDGAENWYVDEGASNRMILALRSPMSEENDWALERLLRASNTHNDRFNLERWHSSVEALLGWPTHLLDFAAVEGSRWGDMAWEWSGKQEDAIRRRAVESLLVLRNAGLNDLMNGKLLCGSTPLREFIERYLALDDRILLNHLGEHTLLVLEIAHNIATSPSANISSKSTIPSALAPLLKSKDRAVLTITLRLILALSSIAQNNASPRVLPPTQPLVPLAITLALQLLLLDSPEDTYLRTLALETLYEFSTETAEASVILKRKDVAGVFRILAKGLFEGSEEMTIPFEMTAAASSEMGGGASENPNPPTRAELELIAEQLEPGRSMYWMKRHFVSSPTSHVVQSYLWTSYRDTFGPLVSSLPNVPPLLSAAEIIKNVGIPFPGSVALATDEETPKFVIKGIAIREARDESTAPTPFPPSLSASSHPQPTFPRLLTPLEPTFSTPTGPSFTSALVLRNLSRALVDLLHVPEDVNASNGARDEGKENKVRNGEMFGLPIPEGLMMQGQAQGGGGWGVVATGSDGVGGEEEQEQEEEKAVTLSEEEGERARRGLLGVEEKVLECVMGAEQLGGWLAEVLECVALLS